MGPLETLVDLTGTSITILVTIIVVLAGRFLLKRTAQDTRTLPYRRQFFTILIGLLGLFVAVALLPLSADIRAQILSVLGVLLSAVIALSSTTLVGNAMAGIMLRMMKGFRPGDFVEFDGSTGRVAGIGLFHTEVQLINRDMLAVPNSVLVQRSVRVTRRAGTFIDATVSIGYAEPHGRVEEALHEAAQAADLSEPFVYVEELLDHAVRYRVYGLLEESSELLTARSRLRRAVLDSLHGHGIEIMSPGIVNRREYGADHRFVPPAEESGNGAVPGAQDEEPDIEKIAFDRAEQAESIEQLYSRQEKLNHELAGLDDSADRKESIRAELERIRGEIERREEQQAEERLDENASP